MMLALTPLKPNPLEIACAMRMHLASRATILTLSAAASLFFRSMVRSTRRHRARVLRIEQASAKRLARQVAAPFPMVDQLADALGLDHDIRDRHEALGRKRRLNQVGRPKRDTESADGSLDQHRVVLESMHRFRVQIRRPRRSGPRDRGVRGLCRDMISVGLPMAPE